MRQVRLEAGRRISFLIAEKSMRRKFIGTLAAAAGAISVSRAQDLQTKGAGTICLEDRMQPLTLAGKGTKFLASVQPGSLIVLPGETTGSCEVASVENDTSLTLKREFKGLKALEFLTKEEGTVYKIAPKVDQSAVYNEVFTRLNEGGCIGIFPEGGSHDRTELLPLKAGVAIMALGALNKNPDCDLKIVPCGMNYFHAHRFRSRAVLEFGNPLEVPPELVSMYANSDTKREATKSLLALIYDSLVSVTVQAADYDTLQVIQAGRRLYKPAHRKLPLQSIVELNRRFILGYNSFKDDPRVIHLRKEVVEYNHDLYLMGIKDHQLTNLKLAPLQVFGLLMYRGAKLFLLALGSLPGVWLFGPVFIATKIISIRKAKEALAGSSVKIQARDVLATWKLLVAMVVTPILYIFYTILGTWVAHRYELGPRYIREEYSLLTIPAITIILLPMVTYSALRFGEVGMDIYKSLRPLYLAMTNSRILDELQDRRESLAEQLTIMINTLGPELFPDFDATRVVAMPEYMVENGRKRSSSMHSDRKGYDTPSLTTSHTPNSSSGALSPSGENFPYGSSNPFFSTAPPSRRSHSRAPSHSSGISLVQMTGLQAEEGTTDFSLVSEKIRAEMDMRMKKRRSEGLMKAKSRDNSVNSLAAFSVEHREDIDDKKREHDE